MTAEYNDKTHRATVQATPGQKITLDGEKYSLPCKCRDCGKKIFDGKQCYGCSQGRPRTITRKEERGG